MGFSIALPQILIIHLFCCYHFLEYSHRAEASAMLGLPVEL